VTGRTGGPCGLPGINVKCRTAPMSNEKDRHNGNSHAVPEEAVREQVARILCSRPFRTSKHCLHLLEYISEQALAGRLDRLKERALGVEVFGRDPHYDTSQDPVVRYTAGEIRKRLAQYYLQPEHEQELRIELPPGSYLPEFLPANLHTPVVVRKTGWQIWTAAALAVIAVSAVIYWVGVRDADTIVERFWQPVLSDPGPVLLSVGQARVFSFREPVRSQIRKRAEAAFRENRPLDDPTLPVRQLIPVWGQYVGIGDSTCVARLAALFEREGKAYSIRGSTATSLADLRNGPGVLIGAFTNEWTLRLTEGFRFTLETAPDGTYGMIRDRMRPESSGWKVDDVWPDPEVWTDYGLVSRIRHPSTGKIIVTAVGVDRCASVAAGELLTSADHLEEALRKAPPGWEARNIQIVFSTPVVHGNAGPPKIEAVHVW